jgi:hypothetical protein
MGKNFLTSRGLIQSSTKMKIDTQNIRDVSEGIIQQVDPSICPRNSVAMACNLVFDQILGRAVLRGGTTQLGAQITAGKSCLGLYCHVNGAGSFKIPLAVFNNAGGTNAVIHAYTGGAWTAVESSLTASAKVRFETFLDTTVAVNGSQCVSTENGTTWVNTAGHLDVGDMPKVTVVKEWQDKIYGAGVSANPDRLYSSEVPVSGAISWTGDYIDIEPEEGAGPIEALAKTPNYLLIFKDRSMKRWDGSSTYPESLVKVGTYNQECVTMTRQSIYYFNKRGIFETTGGYPRKVSRRIQEIIDAIPSTSYSSVAAWSDEDRAYFSIGDITIAGRLFYNCVIAYCVESQIWTLLSFPKPYKRGSIIVDSYENEKLITADNDGNVWNIFDGNDDAGTQIDWFIRYQVQEFGSRGMIKDLAKFVVYGNKAVGQAFGRSDEKGDWKPLGPFSKNVQELVADLHGRYFEIALQGKGRESQIIGIDFPSIDINENYAE